MPRAPHDLTFAELRFSSMMHATGKVPEIDLPPPDYTKILLTQNQAGIMKIVADMVIQADRLAHAKGVDLAQAVRERLNPASFPGEGSGEGSGEIIGTLCGSAKDADSIVIDAIQQAMGDAKDADSIVLDAIQQAIESASLAKAKASMGDGGDDQDHSERPHRGVVHGVASNDKLNIRATASSSAPIIGQAENGDVLTIVGQTYNGSTKWVRFRVGEDAGTAVAVYGWAVAAYVRGEA